MLDRVQQRGDESQVARDRGLERQQRQDALVDFEVATVDAVVVVDDDPRQFDVLVARASIARSSCSTIRSSPPSTRCLEFGELGAVVGPRRRETLGGRLSAELPGDIFLGAGIRRFGEQLVRRSYSTSSP